MLLLVFAIIMSIINLKLDYICTSLHYEGESADTVANLGSMYKFPCVVHRHRDEPGNHLQV